MDDAQRSVRIGSVMAGFPPPAGDRISIANCQDPRFIQYWLNHYREVQPTVAVGRGNEAIWSLPRKLRGLEAVKFACSDGSERTVGEMLRSTHTDAFVVAHKGVIVTEKYFNLTKQDTPHLLMSVSKSLLSCALASLVEGGLMSMEDGVTDYLPELANTGYEGATLRDCADMVAGIKWSEDYDDDLSEYALMDSAMMWRAPIPQGPPSMFECALLTERDGPHGEQWRYVSMNTEVLAWAIARAGGSRACDVISREVWSKLGSEHEAYIGVDSAGSPITCGGFCASARDLTRLGLAILNGGEAPGGRAIPTEWIADTYTNGRKEEFERGNLAGYWPTACSSYRNFFWLAETPGHSDIMAIGSCGQMLYVNGPAGVIGCKLSSNPDETFDAEMVDAWLAMEAIADQIG